MLQRDLQKKKEELENEADKLLASDLDPDQMELLLDMIYQELENVG